MFRVVIANLYPVQTLSSIKSMGIPDPNSKVPDPKLTQYIDELDPDKSVTGKKINFEISKLQFQIPLHANPIQAKHIDLMLHTKPIQTNVSELRVH